MRVDKYGQMIFTENDLCNYYLSNNEKPIKSALVEADIRFEENLLLENIPSLQKYQDPNNSIEEFDNFDILLIPDADYIADLVTSLGK
jgi:hypothetical protein